MVTGEGHEDTLVAAGSWTGTGQCVLPPVIGYLDSQGKLFPPMAGCYSDVVGQVNDATHTFLLYKQGERVKAVQTLTC